MVVVFVVVVVDTDVVVVVLTWGVGVNDVLTRILEA